MATDVHQTLRAPLSASVFLTDLPAPLCLAPVRCCAVLDSHSCHKDCCDRVIARSAFVALGHGRKLYERVRSLGDGLNCYEGTLPSRVFEVRSFVESARRGDLPEGSRPAAFMGCAIAEGDILLFDGEHNFCPLHETGRSFFLPRAHCKSKVRSLSVNTIDFATLIAGFSWIGSRRARRRP